MDIKKISVVIPVYNEAENLPTLKSRLMKALDGCAVPYEIILVNDGSTDHSMTLLTQYAEEDARIRVIEFNRNYGQHAAVFAGMQHSNGDVVVTLDADLQNPPEEIPKLIGKIREGYEIVGGFREHRKDSLFRKMASRFINVVTSQAVKVPMRDYGCMLRAYSRPVVDAVCESRELSTFIPALANMFTDRIIEIPVAHDERKMGRSKYSIAKLIGLQFDLVTGFSALPLKIISFVGFLIALLGIGFALTLLILRLALGAEWANQGVFTLFGILFFFVGAQFVAIGVIGEYVARIYAEVRQRPRYIIRKIHQKDSQR